MKKILTRLSLAGGTLAIIAAGAAAFSAFEAHVVNVTATIENALNVNAGGTGALDFGAVFPQEYITKDIQVGLSDSFLRTDRVDDVEYAIKQKPKVKQPCETVVGQQPSALEYALGIKTAQAAIPVTPPCDPNTNPAPGDPYAIIDVPGFGTEVPPHFHGPAWQFCEEYLPKNAPYTVDLNSPYWNYCYLPLADDLSKHSSNLSDTSVDAFHHAYTWDAQTGESELNPAYIAKGRLSKRDEQTSATWTIDLKVPCFAGYCAQEAGNPDNAVNDDIPGFYVPEDFRLPKELEHKTFGTDLWIEVTGISEARGPRTVKVTANDLDNSSSSPAVVATDGLNKWFMYNDTNDTIDNTLGSFVSGPLTPPAGSGSVQFTLAASPFDRKNIATYQFSGTPLASITQMSFAAYSHSGVAGPNESPFLNFNVDFTGSSGSYQRRLVYVPGANGSVPQDGWNTFDAINSGNGLWTWSGFASNGNKWPDNNTNQYRTWNDILAAWPSARLLPVGGWLGVRVGEPGPAGYTGNVDNFSIGISGNTTIYDFEP